MIKVNRIADLDEESYLDHVDQDPKIYVKGTVPNLHIGNIFYIESGFDEQGNFFVFLNDGEIGTPIKISAKTKSTASSKVTKDSTVVYHFVTSTEDLTGTMAVEGGVIQSYSIGYKNGLHNYYEVNDSWVHI